MMAGADYLRRASVRLAFTQTWLFFAEHALKLRPNSARWNPLSSIRPSSSCMN